MLKAGHKPLHKLGTTFAQVFDLCTLSTAKLAGLTLPDFLYGFKRTAFAQTASWFAQPKVASFKLLGQFLYPVSTAPITNTKLI